MNEKVNHRMDRKGRFGDICIRRDMDGLKLGRRNQSQFDRLLLCMVEHFQHFVLATKKERSES